MSEPKPAAGMIYRYPDGGEWTLGREESPGMFRHEFGSTNVEWYVENEGWRCVGIETPHGRVMVGERRMSDHPTSDSSAVTVTRVAGRGYVAVQPDGYTFEVGCQADRVAQWPLVVEVGGARMPMPECATVFARFDPREQGPGIAAVRPPPPSLPEVVYTWEAWALP